MLERRERLPDVEQRRSCGKSKEMFHGFPRKTDGAQLAMRRTRTGHVERL